MALMTRKLARLLVVVFTVSAITFAMLDTLPGDLAHVLGGEAAAQEDIQAIRRELGLDRSMGERYLRWLGRVVTGDLGTSYINYEPVAVAIRQRLPVTVELIVVSQFMALLLALPAGIVCAHTNRSLLDRGITATAFATLSIPSFIMALLLVFFFALELDWLPATGFVPLSEGLGQNLRSILLPAFSIALVEWVPLMRVLRADMIQTLKADFILMARAKGMPTWRILLRDALKPSALSLATILGLQFGHWIGAAVVVESIFALPGIGSLLIAGIFSRDYALVQGCVLIITVVYVVVNAVVDIGYTVLDPRISRESQHG
ncbi:MAG: ABC transporter permease [Desulfobacterales bacterium]|nr:ABC transporter permease [Desulfobacterales bacterium]